MERSSLTLFFALFSFLRFFILRLLSFDLLLAFLLLFCSLSLSLSLSLGGLVRWCLASFGPRSCVLCEAFGLVRFRECVRVL